MAKDTSQPHSLYDMWAQQQSSFGVLAAMFRQQGAAPAPQEPQQRNPFQAACDCGPGAGTVR
jgi:hypothetical protein